MDLIFDLAPSSGVPAVLHRLTHQHGEAVEIGQAERVHQRGHLHDIERRQRGIRQVSFGQPVYSDTSIGRPLNLGGLLVASGPVISAHGWNGPISLTGDAEVSAEDFVRVHLVECLAVSHLVVGYRVGFGYQRRGNADLLLALGETGTEEAAPAVERILTDAAYDESASRNARASAAWAARRLGGPRMAAALRASAERRAGADTAVLIYLAALEGKEAAPAIRSYRTARLGRFDMRRGREQDLLDELARDLVAGRSIRELDAPPEEIGLIE